MTRRTCSLGSEAALTAARSTLEKWLMRFVLLVAPPRLSKITKIAIVFRLKQR